MLIQTPAGQLLKLPQLIGHFISHQQKEVIAFTEFLMEHYSPDHDDADLEEDDKLPFKSMQVFSMGYAVIPEILKPHSIQPLYVENKISSHQSLIPHQHLSCIFHPPRTK